MKVPDLHQPRSAGRKLAQFVGKSLPSALVLAIWCLLLWRAIAVFGPDSSYVYFNSDGAIPILMANDDRPITVFDAYYYGSDRWGAWPLLAARLIHQETKFRWSDKAVHTIRTAWLFLAIFVLALLDRGHWKEIVLIGLAAITMQSAIRLQLSFSCVERPDVFLFVSCNLELICQRTLATVRGGS